MYIQSRARDAVTRMAIGARYVHSRPRRSVLYVPGVNEKAMQKVKDLPVDCVILDLEDSVAPDQKEKARQIVGDIVASKSFGRRDVIIRVNSRVTPWFAGDLETAIKAKPHAILLPKVQAASHVQSVHSALPQDGSIRLWAMMETPLAILSAADIAAAPLDALVVGTEDLVKGMQAQHVADRSTVLFALSAVVMAARAHGRTVIDGVYTDIQNEAGFRAQCTQALQLGFDGKTLIHPKQIDVCNSVFTPTEQSVTAARRVVSAMREAHAAGRGVVTLDGRMIEPLHAAMAERLIALHKAINNTEDSP